ncbi:DUF664 domain-containing protein [Streptomyces goshikiensis]|uniref:mycothiol transferase n=1 Tax=Streptomyces goshikiensis TaxID=1942 RepID=UPI0036B0FFA1
MPASASATPAASTSSSAAPARTAPSGTGSTARDPETPPGPAFSSSRAVSVTVSGTIPSRRQASERSRNSPTPTAYPQWAIDHQNDFQVLPGETLAEIVARYEQVATRTVETIAAVPDLSATHPLPEAPWNEPGTVRSVRRVLMHLIAETAQHAGRADILRETLDGQKSA